jgi:hypothetical protein
MRPPQTDTPRQPRGLGARRDAPCVPGARRGARLLHGEAAGEQLAGLAPGVGARQRLPPLLRLGLGVGDLRLRLLAHRPLPLRVLARRTGAPCRRPRTRSAPGRDPGGRGRGGRRTPPSWPCLSGPAQVARTAGAAAAHVRRGAPSALACTAPTIAPCAQGALDGKPSLRLRAARRPSLARRAPAAARRTVLADVVGGLQAGVGPRERLRRVEELLVAGRRALHARRAVLPARRAAGPALQ